ncbi:MAG: DRTGG domain-containing protein [Planctomycetota bacterium]
MNKLVIASMAQSAGKTSIITGIAKSLNMKLGYIKPFGERLIYHKKRLWDYDSALMVNIFGLEEHAEDMTIGFEYSKLRYMYDDTQRKKKLLDMVAHMGKGKDILFVEGGRDFKFGGCVSLDPISIARYIEGKLIFVISGNEGTVIDDARFIKDHLDLKDIDFGGVIINKVNNIDDFKENHLPTITEMGIPVIGIIPFNVELTYLSVNYISHLFFAKVIAGEKSLDRVIKNIFVGASSVESVFKDVLFKKEDKLVITSGDRSDMILAALESNSACIILTNNILPSSNIISKANERNIPLLLMTQDTYQIASQMDNIEPLLTKEDSRRIEILQKLIKDNLALKKMI